MLDRMTEPRLHRIGDRPRLTPTGAANTTSSHHRRDRTTEGLSVAARFMLLLVGSPPAWHDQSPTASLPIVMC
jgi:hypothetical protein